MKRNTIKFFLYALAAAVLFFGTLRVIAFNGPSNGAGSGVGALGVDSSNDVSVGTSTTQVGTKFLIVGSTTDNTSYALKVLNSGQAPLFFVRDDGSIAIGTSSFSPGASLTVNGSIYSTNAFSGTVAASNVTPGVFDGATGGNYAVNGSLGVATTTQVSLPQSLSVYGGGYFSGNVGVGTTTPSQKLEVNGTTLVDGALDVGGTGGSGSNGDIVARRSATTGAYYFGSSGNNYLYFDGTNYQFGVGSSLYVDTNGDVGVGTASPTHKLDVNGVANATQYCISGANCISSWPSGGGSGTVTSVTAGSGLSGGTITATGTISLNLGSTNIWTAAQWFTNAGAIFPSGIWNSGGQVGIMTGASGLSADLSVGGVGGSGDAIYATGASVGVYGDGSTVGVEGVGTTGGVYGIGNTYGVFAQGNDALYGIGNTEGVYGQGPVGVFGSGYSYDFEGSNGEHTSGGTWVNASSRNLKEDFTPVDNQAILTKIIQLPITQWVYKTDPTAWHIGPVAEDFYSIFGLGDNSTSISTIDPSGLALVGIQALDQKIDTQQQEINSLQAEVQQLLQK